MSRHAPLPPSSAERWIACPGSYQAEREAPPAAPSEFADIGTHAHALFARGLRFGLPAEALTTDPAISRPLALALDAARRILGSRAFMVELTLPALAELAAIWGTSDVVGFSRSGPVDTIIDLKFGEAIGVEADTVQLGIYGLLAARCFGAAKGGVTAWVIQPRCDHENGPARKHHYSRADLDRHAAAGGRGRFCFQRTAAGWSMVPVVRRGSRLPGQTGGTRRGAGNAIGLVSSGPSLVFTCPGSRVVRTVECTIDFVELENDRGRTIKGVRATCSRCEHETESFGTSPASMRRCLVLMREECPEDEANFYITEDEE